MKNKFKLFTSTDQPWSLEILGYWFCIVTYGTTIMLLGYQKPLSHIVAALVTIVVGALFNLLAAHLHKVTKFLCLLVGVKMTDDYAGRERFWYAALACTLFIPVIMSFFSVSYMLQTAFKANLTIIVIGTLAMALIIFLLDRGFVVTMGQKKNWGVALLRISIAIVLALFIAKPVEMAIFDQEIKQELADQKRNEFKKLTREKQAELDLIEVDRKENPVTQEMNRARAEYEQEVNTSIGGRRAGHGIEARKKEEYFKEQESKNAQVQQKLDIEVGRIEKEYAEKFKDLEENLSTGLGARTHALEMACKKYPAINFMHWIIFGFFMLIDISPILMKMMMPPSTYDAGESDANERRLHSLNILRLNNSYASAKTDIKNMYDMIDEYDITEEEKKRLRKLVQKRSIAKHIGSEGVAVFEEDDDTPSSQA